MKEKAKRTGYHMYQPPLLPRLRLPGDCPKRRLKAVQELKAENDTLRAENQKARTTSDAQQARIEALEKQMAGVLQLLKTR